MSPGRRIFHSFILGLMLHLAPAARGELIWIEAESLAEGNFPKANPFSPANSSEAKMLSGQAWIGIDGRHGEPTFAQYNFVTTSAAAFNVYSRKFWKHGPFRWRVDSGPWHAVDRDIPLLDRAELHKHLEVNWVSLGAVDLPAGDHTLRIELTEPKGPAAFDCFVITNEAFAPRGSLKPGEKTAAAPDGWFAFEPDADVFGESPIGLRFLNERFAGEHGRLMARGDAIIHEQTGEPARLWGVNAGADLVRQDPAALKVFARFLAKRGVNIVRVHMPVGTTLGPDSSAVAAIQRFVSAMKREGIYTSLSVYFPLWFKLSPADRFGDYHDQSPFGLLYFDRGFQSLYRSWLAALLSTPNPFADNLPLGQDPAVALVEMVNEDSLLFWTFKPYSTVPAQPMETLERRFGSWLAKRYGTLDAATSRWTGRVRGDDFSTGRAGVLSPAEIVQRKDFRAADTASFLADVERDFYESTQSFLRNDCKYNGLTIASNWVTADSRVLGPLDKRANAVADVMDHHGYFAGKHDGPRAAYAIDTGDTYVDRSAARFDRAEGADAAARRAFHLPTWDVQYAGKPSVISEINFTAPNRFRAELPLIAAAYGGLLGTDGYCFFAADGPGWANAIDKFSVNTPALLGQFPAVALVFRRGLIETGSPAAEVTLSDADIESLRGGAAFAAANLDALRARDARPESAAPAASEEATIDPLAFAVGPVRVNFAQAAAATLRDLAPFMNRVGGVVRSVNGQLLYDFGRGVITVNTPRVQAAAGFLGAAGDITLGDCSFNLRNETAEVWLVSLDDLPIAESKKLLLQIMTEERNSGVETMGDVRKTIKSLGGGPILVQNVEGTVTLKNGGTITPLDFNGYSAAASQPLTGLMPLRTATLYYLIER